ncbi:MAG TPA: amino acid permease [Terriglobales bacterium]|nr:amino acid permease [Terriglobales bacterium]
MPLKRELGLWAAIAAVCGESIALGIFLTPAAMAKSLGSPMLLFGVWCAMALMACAGAVCYAELAVTFPEAGGGYVYLRHFYGKRVAFLYGWMSMAVMDSGLAAALAVGATAYLSVLSPVVGHFPGETAAILLIMIAAINYCGTRLSGAFMATVNWLKLLIIAVLIAWAFASHGISHSNLVPLSTRRHGSDLLLIGIAGAFINAFFSYGGWWDVTKLAGEVRDPRKNLPRALIFGVVAVTLVYIGLSAAFLHVVPLQNVTSNQAFVAQFGEALFGRTGAAVLSVCVLISVLGGLAALTMAAPRVYFAMAQKGEFFALFGRLHPRFNSPGNAILLQLFCSLAVLALGAFDKIISYIIFSAVIFLALTGATVFRLPEARRQFWYPVAPVLYILCCTAVALMIIMRNPLEAVLGIGVVLLGYPLYWKLPKSQDEHQTPLQAAVGE